MINAFRPDGSLLTSFKFFDNRTDSNGKLIASTSIGSGTGSAYWEINGSTSGTFAGAAVKFENGGTTLNMIGNYSAVLSGGYNTAMAFYNNAPNYYFSGLNSIRVLGTDSAGKLISQTSISTGEVAFASRPGSPSVGTLCNFIDSNTNTWGGTINGGGTNHVLGRWNGTNWTVVGV